jgi:Ger(x)C family germination protein
MGNTLRKAISIFMAAALMMCVTGCWDRVEINNRYFVLAIAIDKFEYSDIQQQREEQEEPNGQQQEQDGVQDPLDSPRNRMVVSVVFPNVGLLKSEGAIVSEEMKFPLSTVGPNVFEAMRQLNTRVNGNMFFGHVKAVLLGEGLLSDKKLFMEVLDELERDHEIGRNIDLLVVKGKAKDALFIKPLVEPIVGTYLEQIFLQRRTGRFHGRKLGEIIVSIHETGGGLVPRLTVGENEFKVAGSCVIKDHKQRGWLGELETRAAQWIDNMAGEGVVSVDMQGVSVPFELTGLKRNMEVTRDEGGNIYLDISLAAEGDIAGYIFQMNREVMDEKFISEAEGAVSREMAAQCLGVMDKLQNEFGVDIWGIGNHIRKYYPEIWKDVKDNWEQVFPELRVGISVNVNVRRIGIIK